jgi:hypothetical protein
MERFASRSAPSTLMESKLLDRLCADHRRVSNTSLPDLDDLVCNHLGKRIIPIDERQRAQRSLIRDVETSTSCGASEVFWRWLLMDMITPEPRLRWAYALSAA